jgi:DNA-binding NarL/FixJ family response regulator
MDAIILSPDLATSSRVEGAAARVGVSCGTAWSVDMLIEKAKADAPSLIILDLSTPGIEPEKLVPLLGDLPTAPRRIVAFGPHVHEELLEAARRAGCDEVMSRGKFTAEMDDVLNSSTR